MTKAGQTVPATGHDYVDGICGNCGAADPDYRPIISMDITNDADATNGIVSITWDPSKMTLVGITINADRHSIVEGIGSLTIGYISLSGIPAGEAIVTLYFEVVDLNDADVTIEHKETNNDHSGECEHSWNEGEVTKEPTYTEEGIKTFTCTVCGETKTEAIAVLKETIKHYGQNLRLQDLIKIGYYFYLDTTEEVEEVGALLWTAEQFATETDFTVNSNIAKIFGNMEDQDGFYIVETDGIYAQNLGDAYVLIPYYKTAEGYTYGAAKEYSALDYAKKALAQTDASYNDLKSLVVDLLNYATAARAYFCITENLAAPTEPFNSILAEEDRIVNFSDELRVAYPAVDEKGEFAVNYYGRNLNLLSAISIGIYYLEAEDIAGAYYWNEAAYAGNSEHTSANKSGDTVVEVGEGYKKFSVSGLYAYNIYDNYYVRPYDANGELADTTSVSVAAYLTQAIDAYASSDKVEDQAIVALCQAMLVYGNNARTNSSIERG